MELAVHHDKIIGTMGRLKAREAERASDTGEDRETIGAMLDLTGLNKTAFSFVRRLDKLADDKREDVLRSLHPLLNLMQPHWDGQSTADMFGDAVEHDEDPAPDEDFSAPDAMPADPDDEIAQEADEFERHLAQVSEAAE